MAEGWTVKSEAPAADEGWVVKEVAPVTGNPTVVRERSATNLKSLFTHPIASARALSERISRSADYTARNQTILGAATSKAAESMTGSLLGKDAKARLIDDAKMSAPDKAKSATEWIADFIGGIGGSMASPEAMISAPVKWGFTAGKPILSKAINSAIGGGIGGLVTDPVVQAVNMNRGVQEGGYSPMQTVASTGMGAVAGGTLGAGAGLLEKGLKTKGAAKPVAAPEAPAEGGWTVVDETPANDVPKTAPVDEVIITPPPAPEPVAQPAPAAAEVVDDIPIPSKPTPVEVAPEPVAVPTPLADLNDKALDLLRNRQPVRVNEGPTLMEYISKLGGVDDLGNEMTAADADIWHRRRPFQPKFVREGGMSLSQAAERAYEAGYFPEIVEAAQDSTDNYTRVTPEDLIAAIRNELSGSPRYGQEDAEGIALRQRVEDMDEMVNHLGLDLDNMTNAEANAAIEAYFRTPASRSGTMGMKPLPDEPGGVARMREGAEAASTKPATESYRASWYPDFPQGEFDPRFFTKETEFLHDEAGNVVGERDKLVAKKPLQWELPVKPDPDVIYRGMSQAEYENFKKTGKIESNGSYNIGDAQKGLTYYTNDPQSAVSYANSFAPREHVPTFDKPAYVVAVRRPAPEDLRDVPGVGSHEVGVARPVTADEVQGIYRGDVVDYRHGDKISSPMAWLNWEKVTDGPKAKPETLASTKGKLRDQPKAGAVPAPDPKNLPKVEKNIGDISRDLIAHLGLTARQGRIGMRGALGTYNTKTGVVRTKGVQEMDVLSHEGGHALEGKNYPALNAALTAHDTELAKLAYPGAAPTVLREEGFAEFFRWYLTNRTHAQNIAPKFYADFEAALAKDAPETLAKLQATQAAYQTFLNSPSASAAAASVIRPRKDSLVNKVVDFAKNPVKGAKELADDLYRGWFDKQNPVKLAVEELVRIKSKNTGKPINLKTTENPYRLMRSLPGVAETGHMDIMHGVHPYHGLDPDSPGLADALEVALGAKWGKWDEGKIDEFGSYLAGRRLIHEWDRFEAGKLDQPPDKFSKAFWGQTVQDLDTGNPTWAKAAQMVYDWNNALWKKRFDGGLITDVDYQSGLTEHPDYVPLFRDMSDRDSAPGARGSSTKNAGGVNRFKGSTRDYVNPINSLMQQAYELNMLLARNDALKALDDLGRTAGVDAGSIVERIPASQMKAIKVDAVEAIKGALKDQGISGRDAIELQAAVEAVLGESAPTKIYRAGEMNEKGEPVVYVWRNGKQIPLRLADGKFGRELLDALAGMTPPLRGFAIDLASIPARALRYGITSHPSFFIANTIRDQMTAAILTDVGYLPFWDQIKGLSSEVTQSELSRIYNVMGGEIGGAQSAAERSARLDQDIQAARKKGYAIRRFADFDSIGGALKGAAEFTELSETGTRLGIFDRAFTKAKKEGLTEWEAAKEAEFQSRDYLDFDRRGAYPFAQAAVRIIPFLNASLQALDKTRRVSIDGAMTAPKMIKALFGGPPANEAETRAFNHAMKAWAAMSALATGSLALRAAYKDDAEYQEVADYVRNTAWVVKLPNGDFLAIPKPFDLAALSNVMERAYERIALDDESAWERLREGMGQMFVPPDSPPVLSIPFELAKNRDNFGSPIVPDHLLHSVDPQDQYGDNTSEVAKALGKQFGFSPAKLDHILKGLTGSWGRDALKASDAAARGSAPVDGSLADTFVASRFVKDYTRGAVSSKEFWGLISGNGGEWTSAEGSVRKLMTEGNTEEAIARMNKMEAPERAYVMMSMFGEGEEKQIHPLLRSQKAVGVISDLMTDLKEGNIRGADLQPISIDKAQRTAALDLLAKLSVAEKRNSLIDSGVEGWAQKERLPRDEYVASLQAKAPEVLGALGIRMGLEGVADPAQTLPVWNAVRSGLEAKQSPEMLSTMMAIKLGKGKAAKERFLRETVPVR